MIDVLQTVLIPIKRTSPTKYSGENPQLYSFAPISTEKIDRCSLNCFFLDKMNTLDLRFSEKTAALCICSIFAQKVLIDVLQNVSAVFDLIRSTLWFNFCFENNKSFIILLQLCSKKFNWRSPNSFFNRQKEHLWQFLSGKDYSLTFLLQIRSKSFHGSSPICLKSLWLGKKQTLHFSPTKLTALLVNSYFAH